MAMEPVIVRARDLDSNSSVICPVTLDRWSKRHNWVERAAAFDRGIAVGPPPPPVQVKIEVDPEFNSIDHCSLQRRWR